MLTTWCTLNYFNTACSILRTASTGYRSSDSWQHLAARDVKENMIHQIRPPSSIALCSSSAHMPIVLFSVVDMDQRGHPDWFAAMHCHTQQTVMLCEFWHLSIRTRIHVFGNLSYSNLSLGSDHMGQPSLLTRDPFTDSPFPFLDHFWHILTTADQEHPEELSCLAITVWPWSIEDPYRLELIALT